MSYYHSNTILTFSFFQFPLFNVSSSFISVFNFTFRTTVSSTLMSSSAKRPASTQGAPPVVASSNISESRNKRQRRIPERFDQDSGNISQAEQRALKQALENSQALQKHEFVDVPLAPIFHPTPEEFANPLKYIASIRNQASSSGIAKIVPPKGWNPPPCLKQCFQGDQNKSFPTKKQSIHKLQQGRTYGEGKRYHIDEFQQMANEVREKTIATMIANGRCSYRPVVSSSNKDAKMNDSNGAANTKDATNEKGSSNDSETSPSSIVASTNEMNTHSTTNTLHSDPKNVHLNVDINADKNENEKKEDDDIQMKEVSSSSSSSSSTSTTSSTTSSAASTSTPTASDAAAASSSTTTTPRGEPYVSLLDFEKEYWRIVETSSDPIDVEYGSDLDAMTYGTGWAMNRKPGDHVKFESGNCPVDFNNPEYYAKCGWNLNNLPHWPGSVLRHMKGNYNGINVPWVYLGMLYGTFAWHNEDNYLYSISYNHSGAPKIWYGISGDQASKLETVMRSFLMDRFREVPDLIYHLVTMIGPSILMKKNINVVKAIQEPGQFMVTFPKAFHGGFSTGFNVGEAVNFAAPDWLTFGQSCSERYRSWGRGSPISRERLVMQMCENLNELDSQGCQLLWDQIKILRDEQEKLRRQVYQAGVLHAMQMPHEKPDDEEFDEKRLCSTCQHLCFFSAVVCSCDADKVACLRHHNDLCQCNRRDNCFLFWYTVKEMDESLDGITKHIKKIKLNTVDLTLTDQ